MQGMNATVERPRRTLLHRIKHLFAIRKRRRAIQEVNEKRRILEKSRNKIWNASERAKWFEEETQRMHEKGSEGTADDLELLALQQFLKADQLRQKHQNTRKALKLKTRKK